MFEKEAEERARKLEESQTLGVYNTDEELAQDVGWNSGEVAGYEEGFKEGAEFGYNKANEWHYVKDGDLPKNNKICLLYLGNRFNPITGWFDKYVWIFEDYRKINNWQDEVIAWKEITPPKEIEEND